MVIQSRWQREVPRCSLQKYIYGSSFDELPSSPQFIDPERPDTHVLSVADCRLWAKRVALGLIQHGLRPGDRVMVLTGNSIFSPILFMGAIMSGGIYTGANPNLTLRELAHQLRDSEPAFLIAADKSLETALEAARQVGLQLDESNLFAFDDDDGPKDKKNKNKRSRLGATHWTELLATHAAAAEYDWAEPLDPDTTTCCLNYSSGTTGLPKGVEVTHAAYVANVVGLYHWWRNRDDCEDWLRRGRTLLPLPIYHAAGQTICAALCPKSRIPVYVMSTYSFGKYVEYLAKYRVTTVITAPSILLGLIKHPDAKRADLGAVENIICGTAPLSGEVAAEVSKLFPHVSLAQAWGMTEITCTPIAWPPLTRDPKALASPGEVLANHCARLVDPDTGREITEPNVPGELWFSSPALFRRYWRNQEATDECNTFDEQGRRWFKTGDIAYVDHYGPGAHFFFIDRLKELIKVKGNQVAPAELEGILLENEAVQDAAVVRVTIDGAEMPRAYVVPNPACEPRPTERDIAKWVEDRVVRYKRLTGGVNFVEQIPRNGSNKVQRKILREQAAKEVGDSTPRESRLA